MIETVQRLKETPDRADEMSMAATIDATQTGIDDPAPGLTPASSPLPPPVLPTAPPAAPAPSLAPPPASAPALVPPPPPAPAAPTATEPTPSTPTAIDTGPSAIFSSDAPVIPTDHGAPVLPTNTPAVSTATPGPKKVAAFDIEDLIGPAATAKKKSKRTSPGRWFARLILVGLLGAAGWFGYQHGPDLYDEYVRGTEGSAAAEPSAPLAFPNVAPTPPPIRTAEFILTGLPETPGATYRVTTDFETSVSQVDITRSNGPDLQVLTYGADAMIRRADGEQWYLLDRGQFPLDGRLERADWVRQLDELLPVDVRNQAVILAATESTISGVPTRHLVLTVDPQLLGATEAATAPTPAEPPADQAVDPAATEAAGEVGEPVPAAPAPTPVSTGPTEIEVWIDGAGLVRQVMGAPQLGADTITVVSTTAEAWIPDYPSAGAIAPLTASALVDLGI